MVSCVEKFEMPKPIDGNQELTVLVPRVKSFTNQYITRAAYDPSESKLDRLAVLVFNSEGALIYLNDVTDLSEKESVTLNKSLINLPSATVVMLANMDLAQLTRIAADGSTLSIKNDTALTLNGLSNYTYNIADSQTVINNLSSESFKGFPMMGASVVDLSKDASSAAVEIGLKILYAKVSFEISVENGTENQNVGSGISFSMSGYTVHNASKATSLNYPTTAGEPMHDILGNIIKEGDNAVLATTTSATYSSSYAYTSTGFEGTASGTTNVGGNNPIKFTFYVSESRFNHNCNLANIYPEGSKWLVSSPTLTDEDVKGYSSLSAAQKALPENKLNGVKYFYDDYIQHYKPKLVEGTAGTPDNGTSGLATYVTVKGTYTDYRGVLWDVDYDIFLGKDNSLNFHVDRNSEYINKLTIKGIRNNKDYFETDGEGNVTDEHVWIDHRVNSSLHEGSTSLADRVTITRETLIDSHIEVRPLRLSWAGDEFVAAKVYLPTDQGGNLIPWIGIERFTNANCQDGAMYCYAGGKSTGKRKYFTSSLITELQGMGGEFGVRADEDGRQYLYMLNGECAWIYFDENTPVGESTTSSERDAEILIEFIPENGESQVERYRIRQSGLETVGGYIVESYEEYLHSYDSADKYNLSTSPVDYTQQGLTWGLENQIISEDIIVAGTPTLPALVPQRYDYFHISDIPAGDSYYSYSNENGSWTQTNTYGTGLDFTHRASAKRKITVKDMGTVPSNAYQYCLSKNKFREDVDGNHSMDIHWYLPDVYELKAVLQANKTDNTSVDFGSDANYWSSQPAFSGIIGQNLAYIDEVPTDARLVSTSGVANASRSTQSRIRCFYSKKGITGVDMKDRVPDGLGGNYSVVMKGKPEDGYFHNLLEGKTVINPETIVSDFPNAWYPYPTKENSFGVSGAEFNYVTVVDSNNNAKEGFDKNPNTNWKEYVIDFGILGDSYATGYYTTLATYPGLTENITEKLGRELLDIGVDVPILGKVSILRIAEYLGVNVDQWLMIDAYKPTTTPKTETQTTNSSSIIDLTNEPLPAASALRPLDFKSGNNRLNISFGEANSANNKPDFEYYELINRTNVSKIRSWIPPTYTETSYPLDSKQQTFSADGTASATGSSAAIIGSSNAARRDAFNSALENAKQDALNKLKAKITSEFIEYFDETKVTWSPDPITWETKAPAVVYSSESGGFFSGYSATCTVKIDVSITIVTPPEITLYKQVPGTGQWGEPVSNSSTTEGPTVTSDELRMYCGNSFTISCTDPDYEITRIKVHYSGGNLINRVLIPSSSTHARFVESSLIPAGEGVREIAFAEASLNFENLDHIQLKGMDYSADSDDGTGWHQWSGDGRSSITLELTDYHIQNGDWENWTKSEYSYKTAGIDLNKYIIIDKIDVKCTKRTP